MKRDFKHINLLINEAIEESNAFIEIYELELKYYKKHLRYLDENKPLQFMKRKYKAYLDNREETLNNINNCNLKIQEELKIIDELIKSLGSE